MLGKCQSIVGQTVSHYRILEKLGGAVWGSSTKAEGTRPHRFVPSNSFRTTLLLRFNPLYIIRYGKSRLISNADFKFCRPLTN